MKTQLSLLEKAIRISTNAHTGQVDKAGMPYILHPIRVMMNVKTIYQKTLAILHDVLEDTSVTIDMLWDDGFSDAFLKDLSLLTRDENTPYDEYILRIKENNNVRKVKIADMRDNTNILRYHELESKHMKMIEKYHKAIKILEPDFEERIDI